MMDLGPLWAEPMPIPAHALMAVVALGLGILQMLSPKGTPLHKIIGRVWIAALGFVAASSFFIFDLRLIGPFSPIHILSAITLFALYTGVRDARRGDIERHQKTMKSLFWLALVITGAFTFTPGRTMHAVLFGG